MPKRRVLKKVITEKQGPEKRMMSSGIEVTIRPFPAGLWTEINQRALEEYPDPDVPVHTVEVVDGTEETEDFENAEYKQAIEIAATQRNQFILQAILDLCVDLDLDKYKNEIRRLEKYSTPFPDDPDERRVKFLSEYVLRTRGDFDGTVVSATAQIVIEDEEVTDRIKTFQNQVQQSRINHT